MNMHRAGEVGPANDSISQADLVQLARRISHWRRKRDALFESVIFADPEWDILLDLYAQDGFGRPVSMSSLCIAAAVPTTTAVRCINAMIDHGVLAKSRDVHDARRVLVALTEETRAKMHSWLLQVARSQTGH
jgi:DNA-binding MarR family transcriptional regulator